MYFTQFKFHKKKLVLHRASMQYYANYLTQQGKEVHYIGYNEHDGLADLFTILAKGAVERMHYVDTTDYLLERRIERYAKKHHIALERYTNPNFMTTPDQLKQMLPTKNRSYFMANFYKKQRTRLDILIDNGEPQGGKWSFDEENRKKLPKNVELPALYQPQQNEYLKEALQYVDTHFADHYGDIEDFNYPITFYQAEQALDDFLDHRMANFGDYEDAIAKDRHFLFHSVLTPALNIGMLTPDQILERLFEKHKIHNFPLNSLEGFVRQIIGWREFMRGIYEFEGVYERLNNHFAHTRKIPESFWTGSTGIAPIDHTIKKILKTSYCHHIERLMILGNFMLLCEFDPDDIYGWFMELFIDAYDWVMVPNVYGMTQYADGGLITTKPYISSSNYVLKMSDYKKGDWTRIWDGLYWRFIHIHRKEFANNQRMSFMVSMLDKMDKDKLNAHLEAAESFLDQMDSS